MKISVIPGKMGVRLPLINAASESGNAEHCAECSTFFSYDFVSCALGSMGEEISQLQTEHNDILNCSMF